MKPSLVQGFHLGYVTEGKSFGTISFAVVIATVLVPAGEVFNAQCIAHKN